MTNPPPNTIGIELVFAYIFTQHPVSVNLFQIIFYKAGKMEKWTKWGNWELEKAIKLMRLGGFEPPTPALGEPRSIHLSYRRNYHNQIKF